MEMIENFALTNKLNIKQNDGYESIMYVCVRSASPRMELQQQRLNVFLCAHKALPGGSVCLPASEGLLRPEDIQHICAH